MTKTDSNLEDWSAYLKIHSSKHTPSVYEENKKTINETCHQQTLYSCQLSTMWGYWGNCLHRHTSVGHIPTDSYPKVHYNMHIKTIMPSFYFHP